VWVSRPIPLHGNFAYSTQWRDLNLFGYGLIIRVHYNSDSVASFRRVFSHQVSLKVPDRFPNLSAYPASDHTRIGLNHATGSNMQNSRAKGYAHYYRGPRCSTSNTGSIMKDASTLMCNKIFARIDGLSRLFEDSTSGI
jgi:hypothetical protein